MQCKNTLTPVPLLAITLQSKSSQKVCIFSAVFSRGFPNTADQEHHTIPNVSGITCEFPTLISNGGNWAMRSDSYFKSIQKNPESLPWVPTSQHPLAFLVCLLVQSCVSLWTQNPCLTALVTRLAHRQEQPNVNPGLVLLTHSSLIPDGQQGPREPIPCIDPAHLALLAFPHCMQEAKQDKTLPHTHSACKPPVLCSKLGLRYSWSTDGK